MVLPLLPWLIVLVVWQLPRYGVLPKSLMPSFADVATALAGLLRTGEIFSRIPSPP